MTLIFGIYNILRTSKSNTVTFSRRTIVTDWSQNRRIFRNQTEMESNIAILKGVITPQKQEVIIKQ